RNLFLLRVEQAEELKEDTENDEIKKTLKPPSLEEIAKVKARTEQYFINEVLANNDLHFYRLPCKNFDEECAHWAAQGSCKQEPGYMDKHCPAACGMCPMADIANHCPINPETNVFKPGDVNATFECLLEEVGRDPHTYSRGNLPVGDRHPSFGEMKVITSPYHDVMPYLSEAVHEDFGFQLLPLVVTIDGFLSDEECDKFTRNGTSQGFEKSEALSGAYDIGGLPKYIE
ncbi:hypothetical protein ACHAWF_015911, partial [Thalassiosira exigua]